MAKDTRHRTTLGNWFRFGVRFLGLTGVLAAAVGAFVLFSSATSFPDSVESLWPFVKSITQPALEGARGSSQQAAGIAFVIGIAATVVWLIVEAFSILFLATGRRTLTGTSSTLQVAIGLFLLFAVNIYSFSHYLRLDLTRKQEFTLPASIASELRRLNPESPTTIVVFEKHQTFATIAGKQDSFDTAADAKVVEKVRDLVDQFRELGGRFKIVTLDVNDKRYDQQLAEATRDLPKLKSAIQAAPESSIFFAAGDRVQRLGFSEFLQLDKTGSKDANEGRGNLVLQPQGVESFARRVLAIQEKRPRVALAVIHEVLTSEAGDEDEGQFTSAGFKKALEENGFDVTDIVLKRWDSEGPPPPAAYVLTESKLERLESEFKMAQDDLDEARAELQRVQPLLDRLNSVKGKPYDERNALYRQMFRTSLTAEQEADVIAQVSRRVSRIQKALPDLEKDLQEASDRLETLSSDERAIEGKRQQDLKAKFAKLLSDVDLLVIPRLTVVNATSGTSVPAQLYKLSPDQVSVVKDFMKAGKPVLVCAGPISSTMAKQPNEKDEDFQKRLETSLSEVSDDMEKLLGERGIELGRDLVMFHAETKAFAARQAGQQFGRGKIEIPPLRYEAANASPGKAPNPVGAALQNTSRSIGQSLDLTLRALRPVYMSKPWQDRVPFVAEFLATSPDSWNEKRPFPGLDPRGDGTAVLYLPKYDAGLDDSKIGDIHVERRGPFPVGLAIRSKLPNFWYNDRLASERLVMLNFWRDADRTALANTKKPAESDEGRRFAARLLAFNLAGNPLGNAALAAEVISDADEPAMNEPDSRLVVLGHGGVFTGPTLKPANEKLLLHSVNWLLDRGDRMPRTDAATWQYPRVNLSEHQFSLWRWGTFLGLPMIAIYVGLIVLMIRKVR